MIRWGTSAWLGSLAVGAILAATVTFAGVEDRADAGRALPAPTLSTPPTSSPRPTTTTTTAPPDPCGAVAAGMSSRARLAQLVMVGVDPRGADDAVDQVRAEQIGGIFIGGDAVGLLSGGALGSVHATASLPLTVAVDDEGGRVQRVDQLDGELPSAREMVARYSPDEVRALAHKRGAALRARGVTMDLAPVVDTSDQPGRTVIGDRSFSPDPRVATAYALAFSDGLRAAGVAPVLKHFPGHGNTTGDSHLGSVRSPALDALRGTDLVPYRSLPEFGDVTVMVGHIDVPGLTDGRPASVSPAAYALLRGEFAFAGPVMTDDLGAMRAVTDLYDLPDAVLHALAAGADVALWSSGGRTGEVLTRLENAVASGELPQARVDEALRRVLHAKQVC
ncbi:glycoside hydrolase family 3 N-terminal domain-containing protein [Saccharothrix violaceirubra]|uniref:beta-N-acetylhexosaminidase n=1 Tax=Saccharothrix violaceirubra TaxID=413306 RepID=A0A7W7WVT6_9PSEU|nr:glycoside hydrolase family 3 N-terminal domain-containing protein [Saccharothrix violaceirubra]MBB4965660.1 beta-N-acetylhexosaminidase [Saccharothrix violaceirubra]